MPTGRPALKWKKGPPKHHNNAIQTKGFPGFAVNGRQNWSISNEIRRVRRQRIISKDIPVRKSLI